MKPTLSVSMDQSSSLDALANDHQIPNPAHAEEYTSTSVHISSQYAAAPEKHLTENAQTKQETEKAQNGKRKYKKREIDLPRRASKRLAGIKVDPVPELKTRKSRRVAMNQSCKGKMTTNMDEHPCCLPIGIVKKFDAVEGETESKSKFDSTTNTMESAKSAQSEYCYGKLPTLEKLPEKTVEGHGTNKDQECFSFLPLENQGTFEEHMKVLENGEKVDGKIDYALDFPLEELLKDPCIAFAVQTLTGVTLETYYKNSQMSSEVMNIKHSETLAAAKGQNTDVEQEGCKKVLSPSENLSIAKECAAADEIGRTEKRNENSGPSSEMPLDISWMDPCIEFAIKSLSDSGSTIPLDTDSNSKNFLQRQLSSSNAQGHCEMAL